MNSQHVRFREDFDPVLEASLLTPHNDLREAVEQRRLHDIFPSGAAAQLAITS